MLSFPARSSNPLGLPMVALPLLPWCWRSLATPMARPKSRSNSGELENLKFSECTACLTLTALSASPPPVDGASTYATYSTCRNCDSHSFFSMAPVQAHFNLQGKVSMMPPSYCKAHFPAICKGNNSGFCKQCLRMIPILIRSTCYFSECIHLGVIK